jgi:hypothetical protein
LFVAPSATSSVPSVREPPSDVDVPLIVIAEFSREPFAMSVIVFDAPEIVLFVSVCVPDVVATVESIATVTAEDPS